MTELTKKQVAAIRAVGKACDTTKYWWYPPLCKYVFSDGAKIYGTNARILFMERDVGAPKGVYLPKSAEIIDPKILFLGEDLDYFLKRLHECEARDLYSYNGHHVYFRAKYAFDAEDRKELYQITFAADGHFQREAFFLKRLIKQAISFVGKGFSLYQSELEETCVFESKDEKRIAIVIGWFKTSAVKLLNDVDLKG